MCKTSKQIRNESKLTGNLMFCLWYINIMENHLRQRKLNMKHLKHYQNERIFKNKFQTNLYSLERVLPVENTLTLYRRPRDSFSNKFCYSCCLRGSRGARRHPEMSWNLSIDVIERLNEIEELCCTTLRTSNLFKTFETSRKCPNSSYTIFRDCRWFPRYFRSSDNRYHRRLNFEK